MAELVSINEFDTLHIPSDEPNAEQNYADLIDKCPWAKRSLYKLSPRPHKAAAQLADTDRSSTVDADNIVDPDFLNVEIDMSRIRDNDVLVGQAKRSKWISIW